MDQTHSYNPMINNFNNLNNINPFLNNGNYFYMQNQLSNNINQMVMNDNPMMIMQMNTNVQMPIINNIKLEYFYDIYDYIKESKKKIVFLRVLDNKSFNLLIPCSLRNNELYYTAEFYKKFECSEIQLFHNEKFLNDDEVSIDYINEGDQIKIIEQLHGVDFSYYDLYYSKHKNEILINIILFITWKESTKVFHLSSNTSIEEMIKIFFNGLCIPENKKGCYYFLFNGNKLDIYDKSTLKEKNLENGMIIESNKIKNFNLRKGKNLEVLIKDENGVIAQRPAGTLQMVKELYFDIVENIFKCNNLSLKKIKINGKEIHKDDESTLSSIGIRENFICNIELNKNH